jgi:hypothetical protein
MEGRESAPCGICTLTIITTQITSGGPRHYSNGPMPFLSGFAYTPWGFCPLAQYMPCGQRTVDDHRGVQQSLERTVARDAAFWSAKL